jgi:NADH:ubiquinone oxidoreductase subunit 5 (subunit L)/multisubunit Na+/H+ antiporter MnhA subunit
LGIFAGMFHLFNHSVFKSLLFVNASALESRVNTNQIIICRSLASRMPVTSTTSVIAFCLPPNSASCRFWSKLLIFGVVVFRQKRICRFGVACQHFYDNIFFDYAKENIFRTIEKKNLIQ